MSTSLKTIVIGVLGAVMGCAIAQTSNAPAATATVIAPANVDADFVQKHPRIAEVLGRLRNERERISADLRSGKISEDQAEELMAKAREIHQEEMRDVRKNDGMLTKEEQEKLNKEEDLLSKRIHHDVTKNAEKKENKSEKSEHGKSNKK